MLKRVIVGIILVGLTAFLGFTGLGFIKFNSPAGAASLMHVPVLLATFLGGFPEGIIAGLIYGIASYIKYPALGLAVHIPGRILMPILAGLVFMLIRRLLKGKPVLGDCVAALAASAIGSLVNTWGVLGFALLMGNFTVPQAMQTWAAHGIKEMLGAILIVPPLVVIFGILLRKLKIRE